MKYNYEYICKYFIIYDDNNLLSDNFTKINIDGLLIVLVFYIEMGNKICKIKAVYILKNHLIVRRMQGSVLLINYI